MAAGVVQRRPSQPCCDARKGGGAEQRTHKGRRLPATAAQTQTKAPVIPRGSAPGRALTGARGCNRGARLPPPLPPRAPATLLGTCASWTPPRRRRGRRGVGARAQAVRPVLRARDAPRPRGRLSASKGQKNQGRTSTAPPPPGSPIRPPTAELCTHGRRPPQLRSCMQPPQGALAWGVDGDNAQDLVLEGEPSGAPSRRAVEESPSARNRRGPAYLARSFTARTAQVRACSTVILRWISPSSLELRTGIQSRLQGRCVRVARHELARVCQISVTQIGTQVEVYAVFADTDPNVVER